MNLMGTYYQIEIIQSFDSDTEDELAFCNYLKELHKLVVDPQKIMIQTQIMRT